MKKSRFFYIVLIFLLIFQITAVPALANEDGEEACVANGCHTIDAKVPLLVSAQPVENVASAIVYECGSDTLMYELQADTPIYPASLVKIMTALLTVEQADLTDIVTVREASISSLAEGAVNVDLQADEILTVEDLLECMLVASANDAAAVLSTHVCSSEAEFVAEMNRRAQEIGCTQTTFTDPHGLDGKQRSTVRDIAKILSYAMKNPLFRNAFCLYSYTVPATNKSKQRDLENTNLMMDKESAIYYDERVTGGRTGVNEAGERCIAVSAESGNLEIISVVSGAKSSFMDDGYTLSKFGGYTETTALLDMTMKGYQTAQILYDGLALRQISVDGGASDLIVGTKTAISTVLPEEISVANLDCRYQDAANGFIAPIEKDAAVSNVEIWNGNVCVASAPLYAMNRVLTKQTTQVETENPNKISVISVLLLVLLGLAVVIAAVILIPRWLVSRKMRSRRYRRDRGRNR